ncbi:unnamed protein product [Gongylonema pulchrum]|uniref:RNA helicase n=1 Tax=Gongylonema pulchrum TaxID=637853 RepID=A0A183DSA1_9BILA|nr:unnamed protein product [Gongylonema pulchrum]
MQNGAPDDCSAAKAMQKKAIILGGDQHTPVLLTEAPVDSGKSWLLKQVIPELLHSLQKAERSLVALVVTATTNAALKHLIAEIQPHLVSGHHKQLWILARSSYEFSPLKDVEFSFLKALQGVAGAA